jgi:hypothetical protein
MPVTQNGSYDVPVMARRDLHSEYRPYGSTSFSSSSVFSSPQRFISNVRSQLVNSYSAIRDRLTHHSSQQQSAPALLNSPSSFGGTRYSRTSSQSSTSGQGKNYNLRQRAPVHSTPRDNDTEQRKLTSKQQKTRKSQDGSDEEGTKEEEEEQNYKEEKSSEHKDNIIVHLLKKILHAPIDILSFIWHKFFGLPWWLLIPLILFLIFYACKYICFF